MCATLDTVMCVSRCGQWGQASAAPCVQRAKEQHANGAVAGCRPVSSELRGWEACVCSILIVVLKVYALDRLLRERLSLG